MNIPSKILTEAINFAKSHPKVEPWFVIRDQSSKVTIKSIRSEIVDFSTEHEVLLIRIFVDYIAKTQDVSDVEDITIDLIWSSSSGYVIKHIRTAPEV